MKRKLRMGMVGGGRNAFIGAIHRSAAQLDGKIELVAGCFSSTEEKSKLSGKDLFIDPKRVYGSYNQMVKAETVLPPDQRIDFVSIVTPNFTHVPIATAFLKAGFNIICDKPLGMSLTEAINFRKLVRKSGKVFGFTHNYTGYPLVKEARLLVKKGIIGKLIKVVCEYPQGWLINPIEKDGHKQAKWRLTPKKAGISSCVGDIGTHADNLVRYITNLDIDSVCAELTSFIDGRKLEDDANMLIRFKGGAKGIIYASQISTGEGNSLKIRVYGTKGAIEWKQESPNDLLLKYPNKPYQVLKSGWDYLSQTAKSNTRLPPGHPEGFIEAFANIYLEVAKAINDEVSGKRFKKEYDFPTIEDAVLGMAFIDTCVKSSQSNQKWTKFPKV